MLVGMGRMQRSVGAAAGPSVAHSRPAFQRASAGELHCSPRPAARLAASPPPSPSSCSLVRLYSKPNQRHIISTISYTEVAAIS